MCTYIHLRHKLLNLSTVQLRWYCSAERGNKSHSIKLNRHQWIDVLRFVWPRLLISQGRRKKQRMGPRLALPLFVAKVKLGVTADTRKVRNGQLLLHLLYYVHYNLYVNWTLHSPQPRRSKQRCSSKTKKHCLNDDFTTEANPKSNEGESISPKSASAKRQDPEVI